MFRKTLIATMAALLGVSALVGLAQPAQAASDTDVRWENFSESSTCGDPYTQTPYVSRTGALPGSEAILGPFGTYFGRSISQIRSQLVYWVVPFSSGRRVQVHKTALPAFKRVTAALMGEAAGGHIYWIHDVGAFTPRTIDGSRQISRHGLGTAIDINPAQNPYRADGKLISNFPQWFINVWRDAGFCWGGDWANAKDAMHFSWMGPRATPGNPDPLAPIAPATALRDFGAPALSLPTIFAPVTGRYALSVADGTGNGAPDVIGLRSHPDGAVIDIATGAEKYGSCSIGRWFVPSSTVAGSEKTLLMDVDYDSRQDLVALNADGPTMRAEVVTRRGSYRDSSVYATGVPSDSTAVAGGDLDGDHRAEIWAVSPGGELSIFSGSAWTDLLESDPLPGGAPVHLAVGDRDGGDTPEVFALYPTGSGSKVDVLRLGAGWELQQSFPLALDVSQILSLGVVDYDGDGRADLEILDSSGQLRVYLGNSPTGRPLGAWFYHPTPRCDPNPVRLVFDGTFFDDDGSVHEKGIEAIAAAGITQSCNPPFKDMYCPGDTLTRAQAATFISRALDLPIASGDYFNDDDGHLLEGGINRIAEAGITQGCNPPANDRFCPDRALTRAEFAAFVSRALSLPVATTDYFTDDNGHVLEGAVNRLAFAGITKGCNPPLNDQFCPNRILTRAETATFLTRALKLP